MDNRIKSAKSANGLSWVHNDFQTESYLNAPRGSKRPYQNSGTSKRQFYKTSLQTLSKQDVDSVKCTTEHSLEGCASTTIEKNSDLEVFDSDSSCDDIFRDLNSPAMKKKCKTLPSCQTVSVEESGNQQNTADFQNPLDQSSYSDVDEFFKSIDLDFFNSPSAPRQVAVSVSSLKSVKRPCDDAQNIEPQTSRREMGNSDINVCHADKDSTQNCDNYEESLFKSLGLDSENSEVYNLPTKIVSDKNCMHQGCEDVHKILCQRVDKDDKITNCQNNLGRKMSEADNVVANTVHGGKSSRRASLLSDKIKQTLQANSKVDTPVRNSFLSSKIEFVGSFFKSPEAKSTNIVDDKCSFYGLPTKVEELLRSHRSISNLYDWQKECLSLEAVTSGRNLIYTLPTSGGKTLVAEILILRQLLCNKKDALLILPFVAIVQEKVRGLSMFAVELDFLVEEYAASKGQIPPKAHRKRRSLYIGTIEKASSLINSLIENKRIDNIGLVVVDELHMLGEGGSRGATLEMTLTKIMHSSANTQIIGMSATLNNIEDLKQFLVAEVYSNNFRPVELREYIKTSDTIYEIDSAALVPEDQLKFSRIVTFKYSREMAGQDPDHLTGLVTEVVPDNSCLIFCPTKKNCENVAQLICKLMPKEMRSVKSDERRSLFLALRADGSGDVCPVLRNTIPFGVAYHHSGLTTDERKLIEEAYLDGTLCVLACTSTLAAGVNLPAKRVILRSPYVGKSFITRSQYKQMTGRAGRAGLDTSGESILIAEKKDRHNLSLLFGGSYDLCHTSLLYDGHKGLRQLLLSTIGLQITNTIDSVMRFLERTLCYKQSKHLNVDIRELARSCLQQLVDSGLIIQKKITEDNMSAQMNLEVTKLGRAVYKGSVDVSRGTKLYNDLSHAQQSLVVCNYLHLLYLVTPYDIVDQMQPPHWMTYLNEISNLTSDELKVANVLNISESYVHKKASCRANRLDVDEFAVNRFYLALMLNHLWKQKSIWEVASRFQVPRGFLQQLLTGAASFAACISHFCQELEEFWAYQDLLTNFVKKLSYCCSMELIPLMEIPGVKIGRAKQLHKAGYQTLQHVAHAEPEDLVKCIEHMPRRTAKQIVASALMMVNEKAEALMEEANSLIAIPQEAVIPQETVVPQDSTIPMDSSETLFS